MTFKVLDLFSGIGGFSLGLERTGGFKTVAFCEIDNYCQRVLHKHWPEVYIHSDIRTLTGKHFDGWERPDVICGGFPCQDVSAAGKRVGIEGERSGLWREMRRLVGELRPKYALIENMTGLFDRGFSDVICDLAAEGFDAEWGVLSACQFGYPHTRERLFVVAYPNGAAESGKHGRLWSEEDRTKEPDLHPEATEPPCVRMAARVPNRMDRLRGAGNSIVPDIAAWIGSKILESEGVTMGPEDDPRDDEPIDREEWEAAMGKPLDLPPEAPNCSEVTSVAASRKSKEEDD